MLPNCLVMPSPCSPKKLEETQDTKQILQTEKSVDCYLKRDKKKSDENCFRCVLLTTGERA